MILSFFAYIDESEDSNYPQSNVMTVHNPIPRGEKIHRNTDDGGYDLIGLDVISYTDHEDLVEQVNVILTEMGI